MRGIVIKKPVISKKPSSFTVKSKSPTSYKNGVKKSREIGKSLEHYTNDWLEGRISGKDYNALKNDLYRQQERLINSNYMKTYSVTMTEEELKLFSEFLGEKFFASNESIIKTRGVDLYGDGMRIDITKSYQEIFNEVKDIVNNKYDYNPYAYRRLMEIVRDRQAGRPVFPLI